LSCRCLPGVETCVGRNAHFAASMVALATQPRHIPKSSVSERMAQHATASVRRMADRTATLQSMQRRDSQCCGTTTARDSTNRFITESRRRHGFVTAFLPFRYDSRFDTAFFTVDSTVVERPAGVIASRFSCRVWRELRAPSAPVPRRQALR